LEFIWDLEFGIWNLRPGLGTDGIQIEIDLFKCIGQEKDPDADQKKTTHDGDHPHRSFYFIKGREE
jgi:hypothetical protein